MTDAGDVATAGRIVGRGAATIALALWAGAASAKAPAGRDVPPKLEPAQIRIVESGDAACAGRCSDWIAIQGAIGPGSAARFAKVLRDLGARKLPILVDSPGGSVADAMAMGRLIRARHLDVAVSKTAIAVCPADRSSCNTPTPPGVARGTPVTPGSICASACSFVLAGGEHRYVAYRTFVGVHRFRSFRDVVHVWRLFRVLTRKVNGVPVEVSRTLISQKPLYRTQEAADTPRARYDQAEAFFAEMGISPKLMALAEQTPPQSLHWLSLAELVSTHMDTEGKDGAYLIAHAGDPEPSAGPQVVTDPVGRTGTSVPSNASEYAFLTETRAGESERRIVGRVSWSAFAMGRDAVLQAEADFGPGTGRVRIDIHAEDRSLDRQRDRISLAFLPTAGSPLAAITALGQPKIRFEQGDAPIVLDGTLRRSAPEHYEFDPPSDPAGADHEARQILATECIDIPITIAPDTSGLVTIIRGHSGTTAFGHWRTAATRNDQGATPATSP